MCVYIYSVLPASIIVNLEHIYLLSRSVCFDAVGWETENSHHKIMVRYLVNLGPR